jgi:hypothetical protein
MTEKLSAKERDAKEFESILNPENKKVIEGILGSIKEPSSYCVDKGFETIELIIGRRETIFLMNLLQSNSIDFLKEIKSISDDTKRYLGYLFASYSRNLRSYIGGNLSEKVDGWTATALVSTRYNFESKHSLIGIEIVKYNNECFVIECSVGEWIDLVSNILEYIKTGSSEIVKFTKDLGVSKKDMDKIKEVANELDKIISTK